MTTIDLVVLDLDGVIRHFDDEHRAAVERRHGLAAGELASTAFAQPLIADLVTGKITRAEWTAEVGAAVGSVAAAEEWLADRGRIDHDILEVVDELRASGTRVAVLTNGTDTIPAEVKHFGISERFDAVFSTSDIGYAKPDRRAFEHVCQALAVDPVRAFFVDDSAANVDGARAAGLHGHHFNDVPLLRAELAQLGLLERGRRLEPNTITTTSSWQP